MRWLIAFIAEIVRGSDDSMSKVMLPNSIHDHPGQQGVAGIGEPFGEFESSAGVRGCLRGRDKHFLDLFLREGIDDSRDPDSSFTALQIAQHNNSIQ